MKEVDARTNQELDAGWDEEPGTSGGVPPIASRPPLSTAPDSSGLDDLWDVSDQPSLPRVAARRAALPAQQSVEPPPRDVERFEASAALIERSASWAPPPEPEPEPVSRKAELVVPLATKPEPVVLEAPKTEPIAPKQEPGLPATAPRPATRPLSKKERRELERKQRALAAQKQASKKRERRLERQQKRSDYEAQERARAEQQRLAERAAAERRIAERPAAEPRAARSPTRAESARRARDELAAQRSPAKASSPPSGQSRKGSAAKSGASERASFVSRVPWFAVALVLFSVVAVFFLLRK